MQNETNNNAFPHMIFTIRP